MEQQRGVGRGSYIWGRQVQTLFVHNTRIERLWYDITKDFGRKWKTFFLTLELHHGLNPSQPAHIWLLHFLFLPSINKDAHEWAEVWNTHTMELPDQARKSPRELFLFGMVREGARGVNHLVDPVDEDIEAGLDEYGVDWEVIEDDAMMGHLLEHNPQEHIAPNPFSPNPTPDRLSHVPCDAPEAPLNVEQIAALTNYLNERVDLSSGNMHVHRSIWEEALWFCEQLFQGVDI
ncbi:hypothetical protein OF83DRAFT_1063417 [Amylostereum chailletii]|nr:hypothetical protein OF83DRAFT_1063417 [Amylostereum chailletii]